jgi:predicted nucleic acid-binding protein
MKDDFFVDSNVFLYINDFENALKYKIALDLLFSEPFISSQVVFECINVCRKKFKQTLPQAIEFGEMLLRHCKIVSETKETTQLAVSIFEKYMLQPFDSKIIASALYHNCTILYSEDIQDGLVIENKLRVVNPFLNK